MYEPYYVDNAVGVGIAKFFNWLFGNKEKHIIDDPVNNIEIAPNLTWNDLGAGANTIYDKNGNLVLDRKLTKSLEDLLKTSLYSKFMDNDLDNLDDGLKNYFLNQTGIKPKDWNSLDELGKIDNFLYGLHRMITKDSLQDFEEKKQKALKDKNLVISDDELLYYDLLKANYEQKDKDVDWDALTNDYMYQISLNIFGANKTNKTFLSKLGSVGVDTLMGEELGRQVAGLPGAGIGATIGALYGFGKGLGDYLGEGGDKDSYSKSVRNAETMLENYYSNDNNISQVIGLYREMLANKTDSEKLQLVKEFDEVASRLAPRYEQYLKNNIKLDEKLDLLAEYYANNNLFNNSQYAAIKLLRDILNLAVDKLGPLDYLINTGALFTDSFSGQMIRAAGMTYGLIGSPGSKDEEGYWNNVIDNEVTRYGDNIATLHVWSPQEQLLYKEKGWVDNEILMRPGEEDDILNWKSLPEVLGLFGFTAGSMLISKLGSGLLSRLGKVALKSLDTAFKADNSLDAATKYLTRTKWLQKIEDFGHLGIAGSTGTIEGGLEASLTYDETIKTANRQINLQTDKLSESVLLQKSVEELMAIYRQLGGLKNINEFIEEDENGQESINNDKLVKEILALNGTKSESSPQNNILGQMLGTAPDPEFLKNVLEQAWKGAYVDFWINSLINGYIHTTFKLGLQSKYARRAMDRFFGNKLNKQVLFIEENGKTIAKPKDVTKMQMFAERLREAHGEGMEEYFQELANAFGKGLVQDGILNAINDKYANRFEKDVIDDFSFNLSTALNRAFDTSLSTLAIKSYMYGALSTLIGGVTVKNSSITKEDLDKYDGNFFDKLGYKIPGITWRTGFSPLFTNVERNKRNAENKQVADALNKFFNNKDKQDLFFNAVASISHGKIGDIIHVLGDDAEDNEKRNSLINALINAYKLRGTLYGDSVVAALKGRTAWDKYVQRDSNGNVLKTDDVLEGRRAVANNDADYEEAAKIKEILNAVKEFLVNSDDATKAAVGTTENEIVAEIARTAQDTLDKIEEVGKLYDSVNKEFGREVDDDVKEAYVKTLLDRQAAEKELKDLQNKYADVIASLPDVENGAYRERNGFTATENDILIRHHDLESLEEKIKLEKETLTDTKKALKLAESTLKQLENEKNPNKDRINNLAIVVGFLRTFASNAESNLAKYKNAAGIMREIQTKAKNLGYNSEKDVKFSIGDMVSLDPRSLWILLNEKNKAEFSDELNNISDIVRQEGEKTDSSFTKNMQRMAMLTSKLEDMNRTLFLFRSDPQSYNRYVAKIKEEKAKDYIKEEYSDLFDMNDTRLKIDEEGNVTEVTSEEFIQTLEKILNDKSGTQEDIERRKNVILNRLLKQEEEAKKLGRTTLYGEYQKYNNSVNEDLTKLRKTGYFNEADTLTKKLISALVRYARSIGKKFNTGLNDFAEGGLVLHADDIFVIGDEYIEEFKQYLLKEQIPETEYNTNEFKLKIYQLLSEAEQGVISDALNEIDKVEEKPEIVETPTPTPQAPTPTPLSSEALQEEELEEDNIRKLIYDILNTALNTEDISDEMQSYIELLLDAIESDDNNVDSLYSNTLSTINSFATNSNFSQTERNLWWDILNQIKDLKKTNVPPPIIIDSSVPNGTMQLTITPPAYTNSGSIEDLINELIAKYMQNQGISAALKLLLGYHNAGNKFTVSFIIDDSLNSSIEQVDETAKPVVAVAIKVNKATKKAGLIFNNDNLIKVGNSNYLIIGIITDKTRGAENVINKAVEQRNKQGKNKKTAVVKVKNKELVSDSTDVLTQLNNTTNVNSSMFSQFLKANRDLLSREALFKEFLQHLFKIEEEVKETGENGEVKKVTRIYWVYRGDKNEYPSEKYERLEGDIVLSPALIDALTYTDAEGTKSIVDFFAEEGAEDYTLIENDFFDLLTLLFGKRNRRGTGGELNSVLRKITTDDFDDKNILDENKTKEINRALRRYFYWNRNKSFRIIRNDNGFLEAQIYTTGENSNVITSFIIGVPGIDNQYSSDQDCGYSFMHAMLNPKVGTTEDLQFNIQLDYTTLKQAIENTDEDLKNDDTLTSYNRMYDLIVKKHKLFPTNKENFEEKITKITVSIDEKPVVTTTDNVSNPIGTNPNVTNRGTDAVTGKTNGVKDNPPSVDSHAKEVAERMKSDSEQLNLSPDESAYETSDGKFRGTRITTAIKLETDVSDTESDAEEVEDSTLENNGKSISTFFGNCFDGMCELIFLFDKGLELLNMSDEQLYQRYAVAKTEVEDFKRLVNQMIQLKTMLEQQYKCKFVTGRIKTKCTVRNTDTGKVFNMAGTLDLIAYPIDGSNKWKIFDIKTMHVNEGADLDEINLEIAKREDYWGDQLNSYAKSLSASYPGIEFDVAKNIVLPLTYSRSLTDEENLYHKETNKDVSYPILRNEDNSVVTGWVTKWFLPTSSLNDSEADFGALPIIITEGDMRDNGTFWNNHEIANGEEVTEESGDTEETYSYSFGTVNTSDIIDEDEDDDVLGFAALGATSTNSGVSDNEWNRETLQLVRAGDISLIIEGSDGKSTVISPDKFNAFISKVASELGISEDLVLDDFSKFSTELAKKLIENENSCIIP